MQRKIGLKNVQNLIFAELNGDFSINKARAFEFFLFKNAISPFRF